MSTKLYLVTQTYLQSGVGLDSCESDVPLAIFSTHKRASKYIDKYVGTEQIRYSISEMILDEED